MANPKSKELLDQFVAGSEEAAEAIFERYLQKLLALAQTRISPKLRRRVDPEDVVQSAYRSFFLHAKNQQYQLDRSGDLWRLLAATTLNKLYGQVEKHTAAKRSLTREVAGEAALAELASREPTVADVVATAEQLALVLSALSNDERSVLVLTLQGRSTDEIAMHLGKSSRTIRRLLAQARDKFERQLLPSKGHSDRRRPPSTGPQREPSAPLRFSDYLLQRLLGSGGMGKVYQAKDKRSGKSVAIKALHKSRLGDERAVAQFVQESQILAKLRHPNIVEVEGLGRFPAGGYFIVMGFVEGIDLQTRLKSGPLPVKVAKAICTDVALGIQYAHDQGVIHCDLKPANVLLGSDGRVYITDFGLAFLLSDSSTATCQAVGGTAGYMAPEILSFQSRPAPTADIYALGAMLWTLVTGRLPFDRDQVQTEVGELEPIRAISLRCLAAKPEERFTRVSEMIDALNAVRLE